MTKIQRTSRLVNTLRCWKGMETLCPVFHPFFHLTVSELYPYIIIIEKVTVNKVFLWAILANYQTTGGLWQTHGQPGHLIYGWHLK